MKQTMHCEHGVFLSVLNSGLLIKGDAGIGKSTLALELIERGHQFVSDDSVHFMIETDPNHSGQTKLIGKSPHILKDLLAVRDLGVMNISQLFSVDTCLSQHPLDLIVELVSDEQVLAVSLSGIESHTTILGDAIPLQKIHAHPKRNLAVIVETAVKNYILYKQRQDAATFLKKRQQKQTVKIL